MARVHVASKTKREKKTLDGQVGLQTALELVARFEERAQVIACAE
jgi:hypothetical protein